MTALLSDEMLNAETYNTRIEVDRRATTNINSTTLQTFQDAQRARATADLVAARYRDLDPENPKRAEAQALAGVHVRAVRRGLLQRRADEPRARRRHASSTAPPQSGTQLLNDGDRQVRFGDHRGDGSGLGWQRGAQPRALGKGRALLDLGQFAAAAAAVAKVPSELRVPDRAQRDDGPAEQRVLRVQLPRGPVHDLRQRGGERASLRLARRSARAGVPRRDVFGDFVRARLRRQHAAVSSRRSTATTSRPRRSRSAPRLG